MRSHPPSQTVSTPSATILHMSPTALPSAENVFTWPIRVYWEDTDAGGIVFYANYLKYFERARTEWLRALGIAQSALQQTQGCIFVVSDVQLKYLRSARLDDQLLVTAQLVELGPRNHTHRLREQSDPQANPNPGHGAGCAERFGPVKSRTMRGHCCPLHTNPSDFLTTPRGISCPYFLPSKWPPVTRFWA